VKIADLLSIGRDADMALVAPKRAGLTYRALRGHVERTAGRLDGFGIGRNDRVALAVADGPEMATAFLAVASTAVAAPLDPRCTESEFDVQLESLAPQALIATASSPVIAVARRRGIPVITLTARMADGAGLFDLESDGKPARPARGTGDCALLLHTSGTTARPKLVPLTQAQLCASAHNVAGSLHLTREDRGLHIMPLFHIHGLVAGLLAPLSVGGGICCTSGFDIGAFGGWLNEFSPTWLTAVPTMHQAILSWAQREPAAARASGLRVFRSCSAALPPSVASALESAFGVPVIEAYAMTEAAHQIASNPLPPAARRFGSVGLAAGPQIAILDPLGALLPAGETGEVAIRGETVMTGYVDNPQANEAAFANGWFRTGDLGVLDADGYLTLSGRLKEMINRGGEKIAPAEIENALLTHTGVAQAVVFAAPHTTLGEEVCAAVVTQSPVTADALQAFLADRLSLAKVPRRIVFLRELPKGPTGKLRRIGLATELGLESARPLAAYVAPRSPLETALARTWASALATDTIGIDDDFFDLGGNSLAALRIVADIHAAAGVEISLTEFLRSPTIAKMALAVIEGRLQSLPAAERERLLSAAGQT
jgi:acyl-CoA synthetase (AMP-forming)/AMP-acid ligase II/acyl carrier protein